MKKDEGKYRVRITGLNEGVHSFNFKAGVDFFEKFKNTEFKNADINIDLILIRESHNIELDFKITGVVEPICDRCLEFFKQPVNSEEVLFVKFGEQTLDDGSQVLILSNDDEEIDLSHFIYEFIVLSLPLKNVHPKDKDGNITCNKTMLKKLEKHSPARGSGEKNNPQWDELKKIKFNN